MLKSSTILFLLISLGASGKSPSSWQFRYEILLSQFQKKFDPTVNPNSFAFFLPTRNVTLDNRFEAKWIVNNAKIIVRPEWTIVRNDYENQNSNTYGKLDLTNLFWEQKWNRNLFSTFGLDVYQWGPGELFNPSNCFFRFNSQQQSYTYVEKGQALLRFNRTFSKQLNLIVIVQPISNHEEYWLYDYAFKPQATVKIEFKKRGTRNSLGFLTGVEGQGSPFIGEYGGYGFNGGVSIYFDSKSSLGLKYYKPELVGTTYDMTISESEPKAWTHLSLVGIRYEGDLDLRFEYINNSAGLDTSHYNNALASISYSLSPNFVSNTQKFFHSGLNFLSKNYFYVSLRYPEPFSIKNFNAYLRRFTSQLDQSAMSQFEFDKSISDRATAFFSYSNFTGPDNSELRLFDQWRVLGGFKVTF